MGKRISKPITISLQPGVLEHLDILRNETNRSEFLANMIEIEYNKKYMKLSDKIKNLFKYGV